MRAFDALDIRPPTWQFGWMTRQRLCGHSTVNLLLSRTTVSHSTVNLLLSRTTVSLAKGAKLIVSQWARSAAACHLVCLAKGDCIVHWHPVVVLSFSIASSDLPVIPILGNG